MSGLHPTGVHESGHIIEADENGVPVTSATLHDDGSGRTEVERMGLRVGVMVALAGYLAERLLLEPHQIDPARSRPDFQKATEGAFEIARRSDLARAARRATGSSSEESSVLSTLTKSQLAALVDERAKALYERRSARALQIVAAAESAASATLRARLVALRFVAVQLGNYGALDAESLRAVVEEAMQRQRQDDARMNIVRRKT